MEPVTTSDAVGFDAGTGRKDKIVWKPLEANENAINQYLEKLGVKNVRAVEIWDFDDQLSTIIKPYYAMLLCFSDYKKADELMKPVYDKLNQDGVKAPENVFFMKQKISNACGTFALFHALAHNAEKINIGDGPWAKWFNEAKGLTVDDRSDLLAKDNNLATLHEDCAGSGQSEMPEDVENHFISYTHVGGRLYENDSRKYAPRDCGPSSEDTLLEDAGKVCKEMIAQLGQDTMFSALALVGSDE
ncbi:ubiquitin carboxyl-terminal hydrolase, family 1 domain-containing protein [Ditylenchus destructor]|nr:ubiquitin carboxyl-terminal hydrolase, family 1 domain-containing protein [Ditylenchus destructor]